MLWNSHKKHNWIRNTSYKYYNFNDTARAITTGGTVTQKNDSTIGMTTVTTVRIGAVSLTGITTK